MAVAMLDPQPDQRLIDPACGTGGFLITAMNHVLSIIDQEQRSNWADAVGTDEERQELYHARREYLSNCVFGLDLNPGLVRAAKMNMVMNNDGSGGLWQANSLANPQTWSGEAARQVPLGSIDVLVANPPFGANILIDDVEILEQYELAGMWDRQENGGWVLRRNKRGAIVLQKNQPPEILFIERCVQLLKPGIGRFALVIPNGILNNPALGYVRTWLMQNIQILAVVDMARELFQPKNDTQTSMVLARRLSMDERHTAKAGKLDYPIFMAVAEKIGHDKRRNVLYRRTETGDDVLVTKTEMISEIDPTTGEEVPHEVAVEERLIDDELPEVAVAYRRWLDDQK
jgi:type I restriction enzyme M protein